MNTLAEWQLCIVARGVGAYLSWLELCSLARAYPCTRHVLIHELRARAPPTDAFGSTMEGGICARPGSEQFRSRYLLASIKYDMIYLNSWTSDGVGVCHVSWNYLRSVSHATKKHTIVKHPHKLLRQIKCVDLFPGYS